MVSHCIFRATGVVTSLVSASNEAYEFDAQVNDLCRASNRSNTREDEKNVFACRWFQNHPLRSNALPFERITQFTEPPVSFGVIRFIRQIPTGIVDDYCIT